MRSEIELRAMIATLTDEYARINEETLPEPIRVKSVSHGVYQVSIRESMAHLANMINVLRWALGEIEIPNANETK